MADNSTASDSAGNKKLKAKGVSTKAAPGAKKTVSKTAAEPPTAMPVAKKTVAKKPVAKKAAGATMAKKTVAKKAAAAESPANAKGSLRAGVSRAPGSGSDPVAKTTALKTTSAAVPPTKSSTKRSTKKLDDLVAELGAAERTLAEELAGTIDLSDSAAAETVIDVNQMARAEAQVEAEHRPYQEVAVNQAGDSPAKPRAPRSKASAPRPSTAKPTPAKAAPSQTSASKARSPKPAAARADRGSTASSAVTDSLATKPPLVPDPEVPVRKSVEPKAAKLKPAKLKPAEAKPVEAKKTTARKAVAAKAPATKPTTAKTTKIPPVERASEPPSSPVSELVVPVPQTEAPSPLPSASNMPVPQIEGPSSQLAPVEVAPVEVAPVDGLQPRNLQTETDPGPASPVTEPISASDDESRSPSSAIEPTRKAPKRVPRKPRTPKAPPERVEHVPAEVSATAPTPDADPTAEKRLEAVAEALAESLTAPTEPDVPLHPITARNRDLDTDNDREATLVSDNLPVDDGKSSPSLKAEDPGPDQPVGATEAEAEPRGYEPRVGPTAPYSPIAPTPSRVLVETVETVATAGRTRRTTASVVQFIITATVFLGVGLLLDRSSQPSAGPVVAPTTIITTVTTVSPGGTLNTVPGPGATTATTASDGGSDGNTLMRLAGTANRQSALFAVPQGAVRIRYNTTGGNLTVRLLPESGVDSGDDFLCTSACDREADLIKDPGQYYLDVQSSGGSWNIQVTV